MLRTSVKDGRVFVGRFGVCRNYCKETLTTKLHDKFYIVKIKNRQTALVQAQKLKKSSALEDPIIKGDHWHRLRLVVEEIFYIYRNQLSRKMKELQVDERVLEIKRRHAEKLSQALTQENIRKVVDATQHQLKTIKDSKGYEKIQQLPALTKDTVARGNQYWIMFNESKYKELLIYYVQLGKKGVFEVFKFIKHVYNAPVKK